MKNKGFPSKAYGICPIGFNPTPSGNTGNGNSTTQISEGEEQPLFWSEYYQSYISAVALARVSDIDFDLDRADFDNEEQQFRDQAGFVRTVS